VASAEGRGPRPIAAFVLALSVVGLWSGAAALDALADLSGGRTCPYRTATGQPCMGCGGTHALARATRGDVGAAVALNPLGAWTGLALWGLAAGSVFSLATGRRRGLAVSLGLVLALSPGAVLWNAVSWWMSLPSPQRLLGP
jgi:hypothetical protein